MIRRIVSSGGNAVLFAIRFAHIKRIELALKMASDRKSPVSVGMETAECSREKNESIRKEKQMLTVSSDEQGKRHPDVAIPWLCVGESIIDGVSCASMKM